MQLTQNPKKLGILATLLTVSTLAALSSVQSKFLFERLSQKNKAAKNPVLASDSSSVLLQDTLLQQTSTPAVNQSIVTYNLQWLNTQAMNATDDFINNTNPRLQTSIRLDKEVYAPRDVVFVEVLLLNALNKTPVTFSATDSTIQQYYNLTLEILDTGNNVIYNSTALAGNSATAFAYKINETLPSGLYTVRAYNQFVPVTSTSFVLVTPLSDPAIVNIQLPQTTYNLLDTVRGIVTITQVTGAALPANAQVTYNVSFGSSSVANTAVTLSPKGDAVFQFAVPRQASTLSPTIVFTVRTANWTYVYQCAFQLVNPDLLVIEFYPASGYLTNNIPNTIYFQAWTSATKDTPIDISGASLKQKINTTNVEVLLLANSINSFAKGKGSFEWTPITTTGSLPPVFEAVINGVLVRRTVSFQFSPFQPTTTSEVNLRLFNRSIANNEDLSFQLTTNGTVNASETYVVQIKNAETVIYQEQYNLFANSTKNVVIPARNFPVVNGAILTVSVYKLTRALENFYKSRPAPVVVPTNTTNTTANRTLMQAVVTVNASANATNTTNTVKTVLINNTYNPPDFADTPTTVQFFEPKGEAIFFKRPADNLRVIVSFDRNTPYLAASTVTYTVSVINPATGRPITTDSYVTLSLVDIHGLINQQGPQISTRSFLSNQIKNFDYEFACASELLNGIFSQTNTDSRYLEFLFGVQSWRIGAFDVRSVVNSANILRTAAPADQQAVQGLYSAVVTPQTRLATSVVRPSSIRQGRQANESAPQDFMLNLVGSPKQYSRTLRSGWSSAQKIDFTQTVAWQSTVLVKSGSFRGTTVLNDQLTTYVFQVDAFTGAGVLGSTLATISTRDTLAVSYQLPKFLVVGDALKVPVSISNQGPIAARVTLTESMNDPSIRVVLPTATFNLAANGAISTFATITALSEKSGAQINIVATGTVGSGASATTYNASQSGSIANVPKDVMVKTRSRGGIIGSTLKQGGTFNTAVIDFPLTPEANSTSQEYYMTVYPTFLSLVEAARQKLVTSTQSNFEQVTAAIYPLIHRLNVLRNTALTPQTADVQVQTLQLQAQLVAQYNQLLTYKTNEGQNVKFDGQDLSVEAMTAYALVFFTDFQVGNSFVDANLLTGLQNYLLSRKNNRGGYIQTTNGIPIPQITHDAWIVYALTYFSQTVNVTVEILNLKSAADNQISAGRVDSHFIALLANSLYRLKRTAEAQVYADALVKVQNGDGSLANYNSAATTFNGANGTELGIQTTAIAVVVWNNNVARYTSSITNATNYLYRRISGGMIGQSAATSFSLKAIQAHFASFPTVNGNGVFTVSINDQLVSTAPFTPLSTDAINLDLSSYAKNSNNSRFLTPGQSLTIQISVVNFTFAVASQTKDFRAVYSFNYRYQVNASYVPPPPVNTTPEFTAVLTVGRTPIGLDAQNNKNFSYTVSLKNIMVPGSAVSGLINVVIGAPSCLVLDEVYANFLISSGVIQSWKVVDNGLTVLFLRSMAAGEGKSFNLQYRQSYAGTCIVRDNFAYQVNGDFEIATKTRIA